MARQIETDVAIIGAGTAGLSAYRAVQAAGKRAVIIEGGHYGTTCARVGCMPSKLLIAAAHAAHAARHAAPFGVHVDGVRVDGSQVMERVRRERDRFVGFVLKGMEDIDAEHNLRGMARFIDDHQLAIDEHTRVHAAATVIATGTSPFVPDEYRALGDRVIVSDDIFDWTDLPRRVLVVGAGVIGLELGQALARLGVAVRLVNRSASLGGLTDPEVRNSAAHAIAFDLPLSLEATVTRAERVGDEVEVSWRQHGRDITERFDYVLAAAGRRPNIQALALDRTSARLGDHGMPAFNPDTLQVEGAPIFLAGDVDQVLPVLHEAADDGRIAGSNAARYPEVRTPDRRARLAIVFSDPQLGQAGVRFHDLPKEGVVIGEVDFDDQGRARVMMKNQGKLRVYVDRHDGRFLGAEMAGPDAEHIAHLLAWSAQQQLTVQQMLSMPFYHPVVEEGLRTALRAAASQVDSVATHIKVERTPVMPQARLA